MTPTNIRPRRRQLYTCMVAVAAALLLAPVSTPGTDAGKVQTAAYSVQDTAHQTATAAGPGTPTRAETLAAEAAVARSADEAQTRADEKRAAAEEAARIKVEQEAAARVQAEQDAAEAARVKVEQEEAARVQAEAAAAAAGRVIHVGYAGGQDVVNMGIGPVLFPLSGWPPYVAEHDFHGGWDRIGTLTPGMAVTMTGLVSGSYTVGEIITVPRGGKKSDLVFNVIPKVLLQTCIPGTNRMVVVGLY